jgi:hypothetical protein
MVQAERQRQSPQARRGWSRQSQLLAAALGLLVLYVLLRELMLPGFTVGRAYLIAQAGGVLCLLLAVERRTSSGITLSWTAVALVILAGYADAAGTDLHLYRRYPGLDKLTHVLGVAAVTAVASDWLLPAPPRRAVSPFVRAGLALAIGMVAGAGWEVYESMADALFGTTRVHGWGDTAGDLLADALGGLAVAVAAWWNGTATGTREEVSTG